MNQFKLRATVAAVAGVALFGLAATAKADSADDLLRKLRDKGVLTEQEYDEFNATRDTEKVKKNSEIKASFKDGIVWESGDKQHSMKVGGRVQMDYRNFDYNENNRGNVAPTPASSFTGLTNSTTVGADNFAIRRARINISGKFFDSYEYEISTNLQAVNNAVTDDVAFMNIHWWDEAQFRFGQFKMPMTLEKMTSSNNIDFMERSFVNQMAPNEDLGAMIHGVPAKGLTYALAFTNGSGQNTPDADVRVDNKDVIARVTANAAEWMDNKNMILHGGLAYSKGDIAGATGTGIGAGGTVQTQSGVRFHVLPTITAGTGSVGTGVDATIDRTRLGLEAIAAYGPFKLQGEWLRTNYDFNRTATLDASVDQKAWYLEALWLITGEKYADFYKNGVMGALKPKNEFVHPSAAATTGAWGLWEAGVRYSKYDASDFKSEGLGTTANNVTKGAGFTEADEWTVGIKFLPNANNRYMLNYVRTSFDNPYVATVKGVPVNNKLEDSEHAIMLRTQIMF